MEQNRWRHLWHPHRQEAKESRQLGGHHSPQDNSVKNYYPDLSLVKSYKSGDDLIPTYPGICKSRHLIPPYPGLSQSTVPIQGYPGLSWLVVFFDVQLGLSQWQVKFKWRCKNYPSLCINFTPTQITLVFRGYKLTYSGMAWNQRVTTWMVGLWICAVWRGHDSWNALKDEVTPTLPLLRTWLALDMTNALFSFHGEADVRVALVGKSIVSWFTIVLSIQKWNKCNLYFFCAIMH